MEYLPYIILTLFTIFALAPALVTNDSTMTYWEAVIAVMILEEFKYV